MILAGSILFGIVLFAIALWLGAYLAAFCGQKRDHAPDRLRPRSRTQQRSPPA